ncbi:Predicted ATPase [Pedobacter steynii]|uniref:Predicted ATPase n=1 Tax=Pedobacter steynii TaxID=430522 RepID=A0A1G9UJB8_9SPHI|nr:AAA family ATPase [Pedobacter steynii]NQX40776.1 AAA family ATPase [Pedobacter steynii]SDM59645.1 Predicted ATPase [Pedobacter steynii]
MDKIQEAQDILKAFKLPEQQQNKVSALSLLALCDIKPGDDWGKARRSNKILSTDLMEFVNQYYFGYKPGSRELFKTQALNSFVEHGIAEMNPDDPDLPPRSRKTNYAISTLALSTIRKFQTEEWEVALDNYLKYRKSIHAGPTPEIYINKLLINSYKSILNDQIELGRFNVFIGANGCGKTNILEALATVGAERVNDVTYEGLYSRGVRVARPDLILSSFLNDDQQNSIEIALQIDNDGQVETHKCSLTPDNLNDIYTRWINLAEDEDYGNIILDRFQELTKSNPGLSGRDLLDKLNETIIEKPLRKTNSFDNLLSEYAIFDLSTKSLRGITPAESKKTPLGINGEGLDLLIATFNKTERLQLNNGIKFFDWLGEIIADREDKFKLSGLKPARSKSTLYFRDKYMRNENNVFSAENSNEGILHVLFYLALFISTKTPKLFAIDNIETALNPLLCRTLIPELVKLSKDTKRQVLITTHNPAILDGLNLLDDEQRLFEVFRDLDGRTRTRRINFKKDLSDKKFKLSELWLKGVMGAIPKPF